MKCPKCVRRLRADATSCLCGWSAESRSNQTVVVDYGEIERERERVRRWEEAGSPSAEDSIAKMKAILRRPRPTSREHWERALSNPHAPFIAKDYAKQCLERHSEVIDREPGSDDELMPMSRYAA